MTITEKDRTEPSNHNSGTLRSTWLLALCLLVWTLLMAGVFVADVWHLRSTTLQLARAEARVHLQKDLAIRRWVASHGGVYVPRTERTPANLYLSQVPERDIQTPSGRSLTLMNPAYMLRQMMGDYSSLHGVHGHITSLKHFRDETAPDDWEKVALLAFTRGLREVCETVDFQGAPHLRLMRPLFVEADCLKCHGFQGYKVGDVRGGVSVSVPLAPYMEGEKREVMSDLSRLAFLWAVGMAAIGFAGQGLIRRARERDRAETLLRLSEKRYSDLSARLLTAHEEERKRIAHEIHEGLAQTMSAIKFRVESTLEGIKKTDALRPVDSLQPVIDALGESITDMRRMAARLRPLMMDELGILPTISWLCREVEKDHPGLRIVKRLEIEEAGIPEAVKVAIYRILERALMSIARQGPVDSVEISLRRDRDAIVLSVRDHGPGLDVELNGQQSGTYAGDDLGTLQERALLSGGSISLKAEEGGWTTLRVSWTQKDGAS
ncbi:MAG: DUF3365 domain-containing protein [Thermodesulfobacteriota bacterium]